MHKHFQFYTQKKGLGKLIPYVSSTVEAGFPSPAEDHIEKQIDITDLIVKNPDSTFYVKVRGFSMQNANISDGDILVIDRSLEVKNRSIVLAVVDGEFTVKRIVRSKDGGISLVAENSAYKNLEITENTEFKVWGVVTNVIHSL